MTDPRSDKRRAIWLQWGLRIVGGMGLFAAIAVVVPDAWLADAAHKLHVEYAPTPLTGYLARHVSLWYAIFGIILLVVSRDIERYRPLLRTLAYAMALFGLALLTVDLQVGMPSWWSWFEGPRIIAGALILRWLVH